MADVIKATAERLDLIAGTELAELAVVTDADGMDVFDSPDDDGGDLPGKVEMYRGRYRLPHPETGKVQLFSRVSTIAKAISDTYHLDRWNDRMIMKGAGLRPDLTALAASLDVTEDKEELQKLAAQAKEAAGGSVGANMGTALHAHCERQDGGEDMSRVRLTEKTRKDLEAYAQLLARKGIQIMPEFMERVVYTKASNSVGRIDRIGWDHETWPRPRIVDLKTQRTMVFGGLEIAMQLAMYAHADYMWNERTAEWEPMPDVDMETAIVIHLPVGKADATDHLVRVDKGWQAVKLALDVRATRKAGRGWITPVPDDREYRVRIMRAVSRQDLSKIYSDAYDAGLWTDELKALGLAKLSEINKALSA